MTVTSYSFVYGGVVPYHVIWNFLHSKRMRELKEDELDDDQREWVNDFFHYKSIDGPVPEYLEKFHREVQKKFIDNPLFSGFGINIPHDQVSVFDNSEIEKDYGALGLFVLPKKNCYEWDKFEPEIDEKRYRKKFEGTILYKFLEKPKLLVI